MYKRERFKYVGLPTNFMEESIFLKHVGDSPRMRVLQHLIEGREFDYTLTDMLNAHVSWGTLNTLIPKLVTLGMIMKTRKIGRATLYKINPENEIVKHLINLYDELIMQELSRRIDPLKAVSSIVKPSSVTAH